jgi:hypothetical protein
MDSPLCTTSMMDHHRDRLRDELSTMYPDQFPRFGQCGAAVSAILDVIFPSNTRCLRIIPSCPDGCILSTNIVADTEVPSTVVPSELARNSVAIIPVDLKQYVSEFLHRTSQDLRLTHMTCGECNVGLLTFSSAFVNTPPVLFLEVPMEAGSSLSNVLPSWDIEVPSSSHRNVYRLSAVVYLGGFHFTSRIISENGTVWKYDGRLNNGVPIFEFSAQKLETELLQLLSLDSRKAHIYIYSLTPTYSHLPHS